MREHNCSLIRFWLFYHKCLTVSNLKSNYRNAYMEPDQNFSELQDKLNKLLEANRKLRDEVISQGMEIARLYTQVNPPPNVQEAAGVKMAELKPAEPQMVPPVKPKANPPVMTPLPMRHKPKLDLSNFQLEKFIGENLINKIGILVIILGVVIGAKYSIEHNLITPASRILIGYLTGIGLAAVALKLKKNYHNFSAVLLSGAMAVFYFDTYLAYGFYDLIPRLAAFAMMLFFTIFTVTAAINYNRQVIAHIGLVGAYAVPLLLNDNSGRADLLFTYTSILNAGILFIAFKRYWKPLYYSSFGITWILFLAWLFSEYTTVPYFLTAISFASVFFAGFYAMFLVYKLIRKEVFQPDDVFVFLLNAFVYYGTGYYILNTNPATAGYLGLFTLINAVVHAAISYIIYRSRLADQRLFHIVLSVVIVFVALAIPVQLEGNWVTLLWTVMAAALFWLAVKTNQRLYEWYALPVMLLAAWSMYNDWFVYARFQKGVIPYMQAIPFFNPNFLTAIIFSACFGFILYQQRKLKTESLTTSEKELRSITRVLVPTVLLTGIWFMFIYEISMFFDQWFASTTVRTRDIHSTYYNSFSDWRLSDLKAAVLLSFSFLYIALLSFGNQKYLKNKVLFKVLRILNPLAIWVFLIAGIYFTMELQSGYLHNYYPQFFPERIIFIIIRYVMIVLAAALVYYQFKFVRPSLEKKSKIKLFDWFMMFAGLYYLSSEFIYILEFFNSSFTGKGLTILWAAYAAVFIWLGINKNIKHIRIGAFAIIGIVLSKLFFVDTADVTTITKIVLFIIVGVLLLISSFFYNKFKSRLFPDELPK